MTGKLTRLCFVLLVMLVSARVAQAALSPIIEQASVVRGDDDFEGQIDFSADLIQVLEKIVSAKSKHP